MRTIFPDKLKSGDLISVISPSRSLALLSDETINNAVDKFNDLGLEVSFSKHAAEKDSFISSSITSRVRDLHDAFRDKKVKAIFTTIGGFNANQLLNYIDFDVIKENPKIFCGYSDITVLSNAIFSKTGLVTYSGPHFSTLGMQKGLEYTLEYLKKCLFDNSAYELNDSKNWSDDAWYLDQKKRKFIKNMGRLVISKGRAKGRIVGGNLCTLNLLQGTEFMPSLKNSILFLEDDEMGANVTALEFDRNLQSVLHQKDARFIKGIVIGRFQKASKMTKEKIIKIVKGKQELKGIPVIANVDFGHTTPQITFPIGGEAEIKGSTMTITKH